MNDEAEGGAPDLRDYARILWRHKTLITLTTLLATGLALAVSLIQTPVYEATAQIIIQPSGTQQILDSTNQSSQDAARNVDTETQVLQSKVVSEAAKKKLGHEPEITVNSSETSDVVDVSARSTSAKRAAADANGYAATYVAYRRKRNIDDLVQAGEQIKAKIDEIDTRTPDLRSGSPELASAEQQRAFLQQQLDQLQVSANLTQVGGARLLAKAEVPASPVEPQPLRNTAIAFVLGLLLGIGLAFLREYVDDSVTTRDELERATDGVPVLGQIPPVPGWRDRRAPRVVSIEVPNSPVAESYRTLRTSIQFLGIDRELRSIQITSAKANDGKSTTLANLAVAFARAGRRVVVVCCDLRRPRIHEFFGLSNSVGFTSLLLGEASVREAMQPVREEENLLLLSAGPPPPNPSELLSSTRAREVIESLGRTADLVLVDSPPVLPVSDAIIVSGMVDATLIVASTKDSSRRSLHRAVQLLRQVDAPLVGSVLNNAEGVDSYAAYGYGYGDVSGNGTNGQGPTRRERKRAERAAT